MLTWLLVAAVLPATAPSAAIKMTDLVPVETAHVATAHALDLRLQQEMGVPRSAPLLRGMILQKGLAPNAFVGVGMSNLYDRKKSGFDARDDLRPKRSKKPAVTFVFKF